jgi:hypothetical protein
MRRRFYIPEEVKNSIREHIHKAVEQSKDGYYSASEDEDTLIGDLGSSLRISNQKVNVLKDEINGQWSWSFNYTKFGGRGSKSTESIIGADGILELKFEHLQSEDQKSVLFQSKKEWDTDNNLLAQCIKLSTWREASFILNFSPTEFQAFSLDDIILSRGKYNASINSSTLSDFLGNDFLNCNIGDTDLMYDAKSKLLIWRTILGEIIATKFKIKNRIKLKITPPTHRTRNKKNYDEPIKNDDIHKYRMEATEKEILSLPNIYSKSDIKKARNSLALIYHPDKMDLKSEILTAILNSRMKEINNVYE